MAWSIVTLLLCVIPGIVAITKVSKANATHSADEAQGYLQSAKKWNIAGCIIGVLAIIGMLSNGSLGGSTSTAPKVTQAPNTYSSQPYSPSTPKPTTAPSQTTDAAEEHLANARRLVSKGDYYGAVTEIEKCYALDPDESIIDECEYVLLQVTSALKSGEPKTGTELKRTFQFQGGSEIVVTAISGPMEMTVTNQSDPSKYVRFYIRQGETATIPLPSQAVYDVTGKIGIVWFGDSIGFGDYCENYDGGEINCAYSADNAGIYNTRWTFTV